MACTCRLKDRSKKCRGGATVITDRADCCAPPETIAEELYGGENGQVLMLSCCDSEYGCQHRGAEKRCNYWPAFAHPRWLTCRELYND